MRALSSVSKMRLVAFARITSVVAAVLAASAPGASAAPPPVVVVSVEPGPLDAGRIRAAIGRELTMTAVAPGDPRAASAVGRVSVDARAADKKLTVSFHKADAAITSRTVDLPEEVARAEGSAVLLAGNVARDEAAEMLGAMRKAKPSSPAKAADPPAPAAQQLAALATLNEQVNAYEKGAKDYRETVTSIIKLHYEAKKKEILSGLEREIAIERTELKRARETAIRRLEDFIEAHKGLAAGTEVPDAMYRLAALYEERARSEDASAPVEEGLVAAVRLYDRMIREYPAYREIAGVHYFLGHALNDSGRLPEAQRVWRSLVCQNHYVYPASKPMPQDADEAHWTEWRRRYDSARAVSKQIPETVYAEVYPDDCTPIPQPALRAGDDPKYVAEIWWQIGNWEFDQLDFASGVTRRDPGAVWGYNRAASAYTHAMKSKKPPIFGVALYKHAWTLFKQQRYESATKELVKLLVYTDEREKSTGDRGADFRSEAYTYIAGSLTNVDFKGPEAWEPYVPRPDILDSEPNPANAEKKLHIAIERLDDPSLIPRDKPWTIEIHRALAAEYKSLNHLHNAIEVYEKMLRRWPMHPSAPETQNAIAETYDQLSIATKPGTPEHDAAARRALEARTKLASYTGSSPWVDANKDDPAAIRDAERLVRSGLRQAAAQHTNDARASLADANASSDPSRQVELLSRAASEYELAAIGWQAYLGPDDAPDAYESRYWHADARRNHVRIQVKLHAAAPKAFPEPRKTDVELAIAAAAAVRDSTIDDKYLDNAAFFVVDMTDVNRDLAYARGLEQRDAVKFDGADPSTRNPKRDVVPSVVLDSIAARDEYVRLVPPSRDLQKRALEYQFYAAETYFLYGEWDIARKRFEPMWKEHCGLDAYGFRAWEKLVTMATNQRDEALALALTAAVDPSKGGKSCNAAGEARYVDPIRVEVLYGKARRKLEEARSAKAPDWHEVGSTYEQALDAGPRHEGAAEAAINGAYAYEQAGEPTKVIALYRRLLRDHPSSPLVGRAYEGLGAAYYATFDYAKAAETYERASENERVDEPKRREAAKNAMTLYASIGERAKMLSAQKTFARLHPGADEKTSADYRVLSFDYAQWDAKAADTGSNRQKRLEAETSLTRYFQANRMNPAAARFVVEAAYAVAKMKRAGGERDYRAWLESTVVAWDLLATKDRAEAQKAPYVDYAAEASFTILDEDISSKLDVEAKRAYRGTTLEILGTEYPRRAEEAKKWDLRLQTDLIEKYQSATWVPAAFARRGAIFDSLRSGLYDTTNVKLFDAKGERLVASLRSSGQPKLATQADELEDAAREVWRARKQRELDGADELMVRHYATAIAYAKKYNVKSAPITRATARLAYYTDIIGDSKMAAFVTATPDPTTKGTTKLSYTSKMYLQARPGLPSPSSPSPPSP